MEKGEGGRREVLLGDRVVVTISLLVLFFSLGPREGPTPGVDGLSATTIFRLSLVVPVDLLRNAVKILTTWEPLLP